MNGFSPVWRLRCYFKLLSLEKDFPHISHRYVLLIDEDTTSGDAGSDADVKSDATIGGTPKVY